jgi:hypothetical protein
MKKKFCFFMLAIITSSFAQERETNTEKFKPYHTISGFLTHTVIKNAIQEDKTAWITFPSYAFDYNFVFNPKWRIGLHNDVIFEDFIVEKNNGNELERTEPFSAVLVGGYKLSKHFTIEAGMGCEFSKEENLVLTRIGSEYAVELPNEWEFIVNLVYDLKWNTYDSFALGVGVSKSFGK